MDVGAWQKRLADTFTTNGRFGDRVQVLLDAESEHGYIYATTFHGQMALGESYKDFRLETFELLNKVVGMQSKVTVSHHYADFVGRHTMSFRELRAAELLCHSGYPMQGYSLLRNLFEQAILMSAVMQNLTNVEAIEGIGKGLDINRVKFERINEEKRIFGLMYGGKSGLSENTISELAKWDSLFDMEVHGNRLSKIDTLSWLKQKEPLAFVPKFNDLYLAMFMNRINEISWMQLRTLPSLQPEPLSFGDDWTVKWKVLDETFKAAVESLGTQLGKKISPAIIELVETKFPFGPDYKFPN
jgi:hypothetical protein